MSGFRKDGAAALDWVASYLEGVRERPVLAQVEPGDIRAALPSSPPDEPEPFSAVLRDLDAVLLPGITHWQSPRFFGYFATTASDPGVLSALAVARALRPRHRVVACFEHAHSVADKAAKLLELELRKVPVDDEFRMRPELLELDDACAVIATIGTTGAAAVDPVSTIADACEAADVWLHVDAAYAGSAAVCPELRSLFAGWERADSIGVNPHKWLGVPMDCSALWTGRFPADVQPRTRVPPVSRRRRQPERALDSAWTALPRAEALGGAALLRPLGARGADP